MYIQTPDAVAVAFAYEPSIAVHAASASLLPKTPPILSKMEEDNDRFMYREENDPPAAPPSSLLPPHSSLLLLVILLPPPAAIRCPFVAHLAQQAHHSVFAKRSFSLITN